MGGWHANLGSSCIEVSYGGYNGDELLGKSPWGRLVKIKRKREKLVLEIVT